jgi:hypothetical protein
MTLEEFVGEVECEFRISPKHLAQCREWEQDRYIPIRWTNILPPGLSVRMSLCEAMEAISLLPLAPEVCLNF